MAKYENNRVFKVRLELSMPGAPLVHVFGKILCGCQKLNRVSG